jgi:hypothetical protein
MKLGAVDAMVAIPLFHVYSLFTFVIVLAGGSFHAIGSEWDGVVVFEPRIPTSLGWCIVLSNLETSSCSEEAEEKPRDLCD